MVEEASDLDQPATIRDVAFLLTNLSIAIMSEVHLSSRSADQALIDIANKIQESAAATPEPRAALLLGALAQQLIETEPGAG
jgi:hypothetical protein